MNTSEIKQYKRACAVVNDLPTLLANHDRIWYYFQHYTKSNYYQTMEFLKTNAKPDIIPVWNLFRGWPANGNTPIGKDNPKAGSIIEIRQNLLFGLEIAKLKSTIYDTAFLLAVIFLHELVHFIRLKNGLDHAYEYGDAFENEVFGMKVDENNANILNHYQSSFTNLKWVIRHDKIIKDTNV
jgi:hypothetical protein